jgi:hypothetical protein
VLGENLNKNKVSAVLRTKCATQSTPASPSSPPVAQMTGQGAWQSKRTRFERQLQAVVMFRTMAGVEACG